MKCSLIAAALALAGQSFASPVALVDSDAHSQLLARAGSGSVTSPTGLTWYDPNHSNGTKGRSNPSSYTCYKGPYINFPARSTWMSFNDMWALQNKVNVGKFNTQQQAFVILKSIQDISAISKVDARVILAVIVLESSGNVNVGCTTSYGGVQNCGLMQSYNPTVKKFDPNNAAASIRQMIVDGTQGTAAGPGLVQWFNHAAGTSFDTKGIVYKVLRGYNSGAINLENLSDGKGATNAYVSHISNYLQGWDGSSGDLRASQCGFAQPKTTTKPTPTPTSTVPACAASKYVAAPTQTVSGTTSHCCRWWTVQSGNSCASLQSQYGITLDQFRTWNTYINAQCTNLWANYSYCVSSNDTGVATNTSAIKTTTSATPLPSSTTKPSSPSSTSSSKTSSSSLTSSSKTSSSLPTTTSSKTSSAPISTSVISSATATVTGPATVTATTK